MTDRWETENSDGMAEHGLLSYPFLHLRGRIPPSKKQKLAIWYGGYDSL